MWWDNGQCNDDKKKPYVENYRGSLPYHLGYVHIMNNNTES